MSIQANNAYIFPGFGLGVIISGAIRVHDDMLLAACKCIKPLKILLQQPLLSKLDSNCNPFCYAAEALALQVTEEHYEKGLIYPPFSDIRKISANIAAKVAAKAYELGE